MMRIVGSDRHQLERMSEQAREALGSQGASFDESDFVYEPERDAFRCPAGEQAIRRFGSVEPCIAYKGGALALFSRTYSRRTASARPMTRGPTIKQQLIGVKDH